MVYNNNRRGQGKEPIYDFVNKATGEFLAVSEADVQDLVLGKETSISGGLSVGETLVLGLSSTMQQIWSRSNPCLPIKKLIMF